MKQRTVRLKQELTRAELEIMKILWDKGSAFVHEVIEQMPSPKPAYNTVSTIIRILERKGVVTHEAFGRSHRYHPLVDRNAYTESCMRGVMNHFFNDSFSQMFSFFSAKENLSVGEIDRIIAIANEIKDLKTGK